MYEGVKFEHRNSTLESSSVSSRGQGGGNCPHFRSLITIEPGRFRGNAIVGPVASSDGDGMMAYQAFFSTFPFIYDSGNAKCIFLPSSPSYRD